RQTHYEAGHNPMGGWMVIALLLLVLTQAILGLFANDDIMFDGPLAYLVSKETSDLLTGLHKDLFHILLILVGLHIAAVIWHRLLKGDNLLLPMLTGYKPLPNDTNAADMQGGGLLRAAALLAICGGTVYVLITV
ncbi:cytochrome b/b6 domain-containing protein, partial [Sedimenticola sp.]|uniref:cytochrome b/b6 domain-containing protein n=1 Tax=Sedimenticola sp. TaxID=1940285 RepID=UPI003D0D06EA